MSNCLTITPPGQGQVDVCEVTREDFICQALRLLPEGSLWVDGACKVKDLLCAMAGTYYDQWQRVCQLTPELDPCTSDRTIHEWAKIFAPTCDSLPTDEQELRDYLCRVFESQGRLTCNVISREVDLIGYTVIRCEPDCETVDDYKTTVCGFELGITDLGLTSTVAVPVDEVTLMYRTCKQPKQEGRLVYKNDLGCVDLGGEHCDQYTEVDRTIYKGYAAPNGVLQSTSKSRSRTVSCLDICPEETIETPKLKLPEPCEDREVTELCVAAPCNCNSGLGAFTKTETFKRLKNPSTLNVYLDPADFPCVLPKPPGNLLPESNELGLGSDCTRSIELDLCLVEALTPAHVTVKYLVECP